MSLGHDVVRVALSDATAEDPEVLAIAARDDRILITYDRDFSELIFARTADQPPAIIYIRYRARDVAQVIGRLLPVLDFDLLRGHMTVLDQQRIRRTPFPMRSNDNG
jgi:predicted nuclease of predicted toxin-antitoxin system